MPLDKKFITDGLIKKGFRVQESDHIRFVYYTFDNIKTAIHTKISRGSSNEVDDYIIAQISKQCRLRKKDLFDLLNCPLERTDYEKMMIKEGFIKLTS
ncbi:MAG: hypothetical protein PHI68_01210 [Candidatus Cloacimonetes bacterium]|nr:hypothetical protein [Candidatus Cloacimonadota bacterium]